jgi:hypothetical protein
MIGLRTEEGEKNRKVVKNSGVGKHRVYADGVR